MCGLVVVVGPRAWERDLGPALDVLRHRGPDARGTRTIDLGWTKVHLGGVRLAVVDDRPGSWPPHFERSGVTLAWNGELYNTRELRRELGGPWEGRSDSETLAAAIRAWGPRAPEHLNGMFAFVAVDLNGSGSILVARDRAGEKPLYWARLDAEHVAFASEIKALLALGVQAVEEPCPDRDALEFDALEDTGLRGVRCFPPAAVAVFDGPDALRDPRPRPWWRLPDEPDDGRPAADMADELEALVRDAVRLRERVNTELTVYVSGGLDSAIIQALVRAPVVYCLDFAAEPALELATAAALGAHVVRVSCTREEAEAELPDVAWHLDTPATWSAVGHWFLARAVARAGGRVVLTGEGADEVLLGYARYRLHAHLDGLRRDPLLAGYGAAVGRILADEDELLAAALDRGGTPASRARARELVARFAGRHGGAARRLARVEWHTTMQVLLRMADRMTSAWSLENRAPFLDVRLVEFAARLPAAVLVTERESKALLREVARRVGVPAPVVDALHKRGMVVPLWPGRAAYDRAGFAALMVRTWRERLGLAPATAAC